MKRYACFLVLALLALQNPALFAANNDERSQQLPDTFGRWVQSARTGVGNAWDWLKDRENLAFYVPGLAQGLAGSAEYIANGNVNRAFDSLARAGFLTAAGHMAPKLVRLGMDYPKLMPSLASIAPSYVGSYLKAIRNETLQQLLEKAKLVDLIKALGDYGLSPLNIIPFATLGYGVPSVAQGVMSSPMPWRVPAATVMGPWISFMATRYGIHAPKLHAFLDQYPQLHKYAERLMLAGIAPAVIAGIIWAFWGDQIKQSAVSYLSPTQANPPLQQPENPGQQERE